MTKCLIVDDEQVAHQILEQYILQTDSLTLVGKCRNALEAFAKLEQQAIDLIFLDIEMPLVNGLTFLKTLSNPPQVIFTTAYSEYALQGYELNVVDYLLKPFSYERFSKAIAKVKQPVQPEEKEEGNLIIKEKGGLIKLPHSDIVYIEASKDYMKIVTGKQQYLVHVTMKSLEEDLPKEKFVRIHKSFIVAMQHIKMIKADNIILSDNVSLPLSINYKEKLLELFKK